jgi:putative transposase
MEGFRSRLHHETPGWVETGALFHIRVRVITERSPPLSEPRLAEALIASVQQYHATGRWWCDLILLMPDHLHALLVFPRTEVMSAIVGKWKRGATRLRGVVWQSNYFDHRIRHEAEREEKWRYIRCNPVVKGLCTNEDDWPFWWSGRQVPDDR